MGAKPSQEQRPISNASNASHDLMGNVEQPVQEEEDHFYEKQQTKIKKASILKSRNVSGLGIYERLEGKLPLQVIEIREFEGRLKKLVYGKETISVRQLQFAFTRDYEDFEDLNNPESTFFRIMTSHEFKQDESDEEMSIQYLLLLGVLYC